MKDTRRNQIILYVSLLCCLILIASLFLPWTHLRDISDAVQVPSISLWLFSRHAEFEWIPGERVIILGLGIWSLMRLLQCLCFSSDRKLLKCRIVPMVTGISAIVVGFAEVFVTFYYIGMGSSFGQAVGTTTAVDYRVGIGVLVCLFSGVLLAGLIAILPKQDTEKTT